MNNSFTCKVELVDFEAVPIAVMEHRGAPILLANTIKKFIEWRKMNNLSPTTSKTFNLIYNDPNTTDPEDYRFDLCSGVKHPVAANDYGVKASTIAAGKCALVRHIGSDDTIGVVVNYLYSQWLPNSGYEARDFPLFFERVSFFPTVAENEMITGIYLPIK